MTRGGGSRGRSGIANKDEGGAQPYRWTCRRSLNAHGNRTAAELLAEIPLGRGDCNRYGAGGAVAALEDEMKTVLGKPAAVFLPSGTMAQQAVLRVHRPARGANRRLHATCHLELHEDKAYQRLHGLTGVVIGEPRRLNHARRS